MPCVITQAQLIVTSEVMEAVRGQKHPSEAKNKYAYVITQDICNKFIEVNFFVGCMVSRPNRLQQDLTTMSLINKIIGLGQWDVHLSNSKKMGLEIYFSPLQ